jgi:putative transposase
MATLFPEVEGTWDAFGLPTQILVDNGWEFKSPSLQDALRDIGTELTWSPVQTPPYKAIGERFFKSLNDKLFHKVPGGVPARPTEARLINTDPKKDAVISLGALDELMHEAIVGYHDKEFHDGIDDFPGKSWARKAKSIPVIDDITMLDHLLGRKARVRLDRRGVAFKNMWFHDQAKTSMLLNDMARRAKQRGQSKSPVGSMRCLVDIKWNPLDASQIQVWNDGVKPPRYVTLPNRDRQFVNMPPGNHRQRDARSEFVRPISFWHAEQVRIFAKESNLPYELDEQKWIARDKLRVKWEKIAGLLPMRDHKDVLRGLAQTQGQFDVPLRPADEPMQASDVLFAVAEPSPSGMNRATLVPQQVAAFERDEEERRPEGKPKTEKEKAKRRRTMREKKQADADVRAEAATEQAKERTRRAASQQEENKARSERTELDGTKPVPDIDIDDFLDSEE